MLDAVPRQVDRQQRRRQIADALWRVAGTDGFEGVSLRRVAREAGVSMGLVQHYFRSREQLLLFAFDSVAERVGRRYAAALAELPQPVLPRERVRALLLQWLPLDEERRQEAYSQFAFAADGARDGPLRARLRAGFEEARAFLSEQVRAAPGARSTDPEQDAAALLALNDGLAAHVLAGFLAPGQACAVLDRQLDAVFGPAAP